MHMSRHAARQAAALARQAATLAEAAGPGPASSSVAEAVSASSHIFLPSLARPQAAGARPAGRGCHTAASSAAAASRQQPWWQQTQQRGLHALALQQGGGQQLVAAAAAAASHSSSAVAAAPWRAQQQRSWSAQAEPAPSTSSSASFSTDGLTLSDAAVERLKELQAQGSGPVTLRVTVEGGGCSGFQYEFSVEEAGAPVGETDRVFERDGVRLVSDDISLDFLKGATVDYESDLMRSAFVVAANPNAASSCGCGSSFVAK